MDEEELYGGLNASVEGVGENGRPRRFYVVATARSSKFVENIERADDRNWTDEIPLSRSNVILLFNRFGKNLGEILYKELDLDLDPNAQNLETSDEKQEYALNNYFTKQWSEEVYSTYRDNFHGFDVSNSKIAGEGEFRWDIRLQRVYETPSEPLQPFTRTKAINRLRNIYGWVKSLPPQILEAYLPAFTRKYGANTSIWPDIETYDETEEPFALSLWTNNNPIAEEEDVEEEEEDNIGFDDLSMAEFIEEPPNCLYFNLEKPQTLLPEFVCRNDIGSPKEYIERFMLDNKFKVTKSAKSRRFDYYDLNQDEAHSYSKDEYDIWIISRDGRNRINQHLIALRRFTDDRLSKIVNVGDEDAADILLVEGYIGENKKYCYLLLLYLLLTHEDYKKFNGILTRVMIKVAKDDQGNRKYFCPFVSDMAEKHLFFGFQRCFSIAKAFNETNSNPLSLAAYNCKIPQESYDKKYEDVFSNERPEFPITPKRLFSPDSKEEARTIISDYVYGTRDWDFMQNPEANFRNFSNNFKGFFMYRKNLSESEFRGAVSYITSLIVNPEVRGFYHGNLEGGYADELEFFENDDVQEPWTGKIVIK